ncbi:MAG: hypothetical protein JW917_04835 [Ignavibacteria bacterium]|nr:hypothetical protein [Ignavibacteria bacterium]
MRTKQVRPEKKEFEYELLLSYGHDIFEDRDYVLFDFRTTKIFEHFIYRINATQKVDMQNKEITFNIEGLSAPVLDLSHSGFSNYQYRLHDFKRETYTLKIMRNGKNTLTYQIRFAKKEIKIQKEPKKSFIKLIIK